MEGGQFSFKASLSLCFYSIVVFLIFYPLLGASFLSNSCSFYCCLL